MFVGFQSKSVTKLIKSAVRNVFVDHHCLSLLWLCSVISILTWRNQNINSASDKRFVIDARTLFQCLFAFIDTEEKYLLRRIPPASYGSLNSYMITNKEAHIINGKQLVGILHLGSLKVEKIITTCHSTTKISLNRNIHSRQLCEMQDTQMTSFMLKKRSWDSSFITNFRCHTPCLGCLWFLIVVTKT